MNMVLKVDTGMVGSTRTVDLGYTKEEWDALDIEEQGEIQNEAMWNVLNIWVEEEGDK